MYNIVRILETVMAGDAHGEIHLKHCPIVALKTVYK